MRILHLESSPGWGGQEIRSYKEAEGLRKRGYNIFFAIEKNGGLVNRLKEAGFKVYEIRFKKIFWPLTIFQLIWIIIKNKIEIVNTHSSNDSWLGGVAARITRRKIIRTRHLSTPIRPGINSYLLYNFFSDFVITTCQSIVETICSQSRKGKNLCLSIPTGVDIDNIVYDEKKTKAFREQLGILETDFLVGTACFMRSWKGIDDFLEAANLLRHEKSIKWMIIGGGHAEKYIKKAKDLYLEEKVFFTGHLETPFTALASLNVFTLLSTAHEGVSQASLQAGFLKKPIIGTTTGGIKEICIDNRTGILVPVFSPDKVKEAVLTLKNNPERCKDMGERARELVLSKFTYSCMLDSLEKVYSLLLGKKYVRLN